MAVAVLCAGCGGSDVHAAAAGKARAVCHQLKTEAPASNVNQAKTQLQTLSKQANDAAHGDHQWQRLADAVTDQYSTVTAAEKSGSQGSTLIAKINQDQAQITKACEAADPKDAWGRSVYVPSDAMSPTIKAGDTVAFEPYQPSTQLRRGSIVVFRGPASWSLGMSDARFVKRVIALGGEHVVCCDGDGRITVNGKPLSEPYLARGDKPSDTPFDVTVPAGRLWVMGDNRAGSADSRAHMSDHDGTIPSTAIAGVISRIIAPPDRARSIPTPAY